MLTEAGERPLVEALTPPEILAAGRTIDELVGDIVNTIVPPSG